MTWEEHVEKVGAHLALGQTEIYLADGEFPWSYVTRCEPGGTHRLEIDTDVWFYAEHPCGLTFRWCFDIEPHSANGKPEYHIAVDEAKKVLAFLPESLAAGFRSYLTTCAVAVEKKAAEWQRIVDHQRDTARALRRILG